jgi:hypothetical protein
VLVFVLGGGLGIASPLIQAGYVAPMRYSLRTLLIILALGPPILAVAWWLRGELLQMAVAAVFWALLVGAPLLGPDLLKAKS